MIPIIVAVGALAVLGTLIWVLARNQRRKDLEVDENPEIARKVHDLGAEPSKRGDALLDDIRRKRMSDPDR